MSSEQKNTKKKLIIVESPSKASTIKKYLGKDYEVLSSMGHIIDLPKSKLGIDLDTFTPQYIIMRDKYKIIKELRSKVEDSKEIYLASDPDREGEAIAWHLKNDFINNVLKKKSLDIPIKRVKFNEITKDEILSKINQSEDIDINLVNAQQGRRCIDRLFGYKLSPLLWKKVKSKLSAGRVQSAALRMICEREEEINKFKREEYWIIKAKLKHKKTEFIAELTKKDNKKIEIKNIDEVKQIEKELKQNDYIVSDIKTKTVNRNPLPPFITSTLQQAANTILGFASAKTMLIAQQLYEGIDIGKTRTGLITYMRTDSLRISPIAIEKARKYIADNIGKEYLPDEPNYYKNKKNSQDAHEAIRPSDINLEPEKIKEYLTSDQYKLYNLIWRRFIASQMKPSETLQKSIDITNGRYQFDKTFSKLIFDGWTKIYDFNKSEKNENIPENINLNDKLDFVNLEKEQKWTEPPPRYTEASLVKEMEENGIGRPSTYAPTISTLYKRYYIKKDKKSLIPTDLGKAVNEILVNNFDEIVNNNFTAEMEENLDKVEEENLDWKNLVKEFNKSLDNYLEKAYKNIESIKGAFDEKTDFVCDKCGKPMLKKIGKYGVFLACSGWPECKNAKPIPIGKCPVCGSDLIYKKGKRGKKFVGCSNYPECEFITFYEPVNNEFCPECKNQLFIKNEKGKYTLICLKPGCNYEIKKE